MKTFFFNLILTSLIVLSNNSYTQDTEKSILYYKQDCSRARSDSSQESTFQRNGQKYPTFHLIKLARRYFIKSNMEYKYQRVIDSDEEYNYVVLNDHNQSLLLGHGNHFFISQKALCVLVAGEVSFKGGDILYVNNESGGYHKTTADLSEKEKKEHLLFTKNMIIKKFKTTEIKIQIR